MSGRRSAEISLSRPAWLSSTSTMCETPIKRMAATPVGATHCASLRKPATASDGHAARARERSAPSSADIVSNSWAESERAWAPARSPLGWRLCASSHVVGERHTLSSRSIALAQSSSNLLLTYLHSASHWHYPAMSATRFFCPFCALTRELSDVCAEL